MSAKLSIDGRCALQFAPIVSRQLHGDSMADALPCGRRDDNQARWRSACFRVDLGRGFICVADHPR